MCPLPNEEDFSLGLHILSIKVLLLHFEDTFKVTLVYK